MALGDIYRVSLVGTANLGQELVNVLHYEQTAATIVIGAGEGFVAAWQDQVEALFLATFNNGCTLDKIEVRGVTDPTYGYDYIYSPAANGTGGSTTPLPPISAAGVTWVTGLIGRSYRGRSYLWPTVVGNQNSGVITSGYKATCEAYADAAWNIFNVLLPQNGSWRMVIHSATVPADTRVVGSVVRDDLHRQERRTRGIGS